MTVDKIQFGSQLKELRNKKKFTVRQAALQANLSNSFWSQVENGKRNIPKPATLEKMATGLRVPKDQIFNMAGISTEVSKNSDEPEYIDLKQQIDDKKKIMTFEGRIIPDEDLEYMERLLRGGKKD
ncbi:helix-turn-helix domain-containing protein [Levilactobacillus namurensis]|uniref:Helix-turn-helix transcriptional regulator n=1 Tax=Levilactobacillus namurensis TaxID=380393 RepID=A0AAW8W863_9LACO|nr:helix-turn-helix transcriptional regulator [Levilactobacillus namurensis]MDT7014690.1 helix-turn-helix transcriptional regulator [Levilactobacillus namurensis]